MCCKLFRGDESFDAHFQSLYKSHPYTDPLVRCVGGVAAPHFVDVPLQSHRAGLGCVYVGTYLYSVGISGLEE